MTQLPTFWSAALKGLVFSVVLCGAGTLLATGAVLLFEPEAAMAVLVIPAAFPVIAVLSMIASMLHSLLLGIDRTGPPLQSVPVPPHEGAGGLDALREGEGATLPRRPSGWGIAGAAIAALTYCLLLEVLLHLLGPKVMRIPPFVMGSLRFSLLLFLPAGWALGTLMSKRSTGAIRPVWKLWLFLLVSAILMGGIGMIRAGDEPGRFSLDLSGAFLGELHGVASLQAGEEIFHLYLDLETEHGRGRIFLPLPSLGLGDYGIRSEEGPAAASLTLLFGEEVAQYALDGNIRVTRSTRTGVEGELILACVPRNRGEASVDPSRQHILMHGRFRAPYR